MDIAMFVDEFPPFFRGGLGTYAMEMTRKFVILGNNVMVFTRNTGDANTKELWYGVEVHRPKLADLTSALPFLIPWDVKKWSLEMQKFFGETLLYNFLSATKLANDLIEKERRKVDVIVSHDWLAAIGGMIAKDTIKNLL